MDGDFQEVDKFSTVRTHCDTQHLSLTGHLTWRISSFSLCMEDIVNRGFMASSCIRTSGEPGTWKLVICPKGRNEEFSDFVSIYLCLMTTRGEENCEHVLSPDVLQCIGMSIDQNLTPVIIPSCKISIINYSGNSVNTIEFAATNYVTGIDKFINRDDLIAQKCRLLPNDVLTVSCTLTVTKKLENTWKLPCSPIGTCKNSVLAQDLNLLLESKTFSDVVLKAGKRQIPAHKNILASRSPVFAAMFQQDMIENKTNIVDISDIDAEVLWQLVRYMYTDKCSIFEVGTAMELLAAADKYDIASLKAYCADYLIRNLTFDNACEIMALAMAHSEIGLHEKCMEYFCQELNFRIASGTEWKSRFLTHPHILVDILEYFVRKQQVSKLG